jgi:hypothetical protein
MTIEGEARRLPGILMHDVWRNAGADIISIAHYEWGRRIWVFRLSLRLPDTFISFGGA